MTKKQIAAARKKPGGSNVGKRTFANGEKRHGPYAGESGGAPAGSYPIPDRKHAVAALRLAGHAPNPSGIRKKVYAKYPTLHRHKMDGGLVQELCNIGKKRSVNKKFAAGGFDWSSMLGGQGGTSGLLGMLSNSGSSQNNQQLQYSQQPTITGDEYYDNLLKARKTSDMLANSAGALKGVNISRGAQEKLSGLIAGPEDAFGVKKTSDVQVATSGFLDTRQGLTDALSDIQKGKVDAGTAMDILVPGVGAVMSNNEKKQERERIKNLKAGKLSLATQLSSGYKKGGAIEGRGTAKSDSIDLKTPNGSFIVPAENADHAEELGKSYLGWDKEEKVKRNNGGSGIKVSNGEVLFTPEEVRVLKYHGVNLDELAPKAENKIGMKEGGKKDPRNSDMFKKYYKRIKSGVPDVTDEEILNEWNNTYGDAYGKIEGSKSIARSATKPVVVPAAKTPNQKSNPFADWTHDKTQDLVINDKTKTAYDRSGAEYVFSQPLDDSGNPMGDGKYVKMKSGSPLGVNTYHDVTKGPDKETPNWLKNVPELAGALQTAAGLTGLAKAGSTPDLTVSRSLKNMSSEMRKDAEYGLEPGVKAAMLNQSEKVRRDVTNAIINRGGSASDVMSNLQSVLGTTIDKKYNIELADAAEKARKKGLYYGSVGQIGNQEFDISKIKLDEYYKNQDMFAGLVSAGISNIVGARQLKTEQDMIKAIGTNKPTWK